MDLRQSNTHPKVTKLSKSASEVVYGKVAPIVAIGLTQLSLYINHLGHTLY
jgi:ABC-type Na+ efflux pump permease subunit